MRYLVTGLLLFCLVGVVFSGPSAAQAGDAGKAAFDRVCADCHGPDARGKKEPDDAPSLVPMTKDFDGLLAVVREGGCRMPAIPQNRVSDDEVRQILGYLKSIGTSSAAARTIDARPDC